MASTTESEEDMMQCEYDGCRTKTEPDSHMLDYCAMCSKNLCCEHMVKGCCGHVPAKSGSDRDVDLAERLRIGLSGMTPGQAATQFEHQPTLWRLELVEALLKGMGGGAFTVLFTDSARGMAAGETFERWQAEGTSMAGAAEPIGLMKLAAQFEHQSTLWRLKLVQALLRSMDGVRFRVQFTGSTRGRAGREAFEQLGAECVEDESFERIVSE